MILRIMRFGDDANSRVAHIKKLRQKIDKHRTTSYSDKFGELDINFDDTEA